MMLIFPGWFSTAAGPDYRESVIADLDGNLRRGDVEIHVGNEPGGTTGTIATTHTTTSSCTSSSVAGQIIRRSRPQG